MKRVVIIGGGIAGLTTAYRLEQGGRGAIRYSLVESLSRFGGKITSVHQDGFLVEGGPDSFYSQKSAGLELCRDLGLEDQLIGVKAASHQALIWSNGRLRPLPLSPVRIAPFLKSSLISWPGKLRIAADLFIPPRADGADESLAEFARRRLGREALHKIADPLLAGIHAADPERLSLKSTFPGLQELERKYGSLIRAAFALKNGKRTSVAGKPPLSSLVTLRGGMQQMVDAIVSKLDPRSLYSSCRIRAIVPRVDYYEVLLDGESRLRADAIVFATPAYITADFVERIAPKLASKLRKIPYVSSATVSLAFRRSDVQRMPDGSGYLVPHRERRSILGCTWCSNKFEGRAPDDYVLTRVFIGGARNEYLAEQEDDRLIALARQELVVTMGIHTAPVLAKVYRCPKANPQYEVGHQARVAEIDRLISEHGGLYLAGAGYHGIGIPDCIQSGNRAAQTLLGDITGAERPESSCTALIEEAL